MTVIFNAAVTKAKQQVRSAKTELERLKQLENVTPTRV
jgi:hypothetical protein